MKLTYSINALANEFNLDRRTVGKRLQDVPPAESHQVGDRTERRWHLDDVVGPLSLAAGAPKAEEREGLALAIADHIIAKTLFPQIVSSKSFRGTLCGYARQELKLTKVEALRLYQAAVIALSEAIAEAFPDRGIEFVIPDELVELRTLGAAAWVEKHWPDAVHASAPNGPGAD